MNTVILQLDFRLQGGKSSDSAGGVHVFCFFSPGKNSSIFNVLYSETGWHKPQFCRDHLPWGMKSRCMLTENAEGHILRSSSHDHSGWFQREVNIAFLLYTPTLCHTEGNASEQEWMKPDTSSVRNAEKKREYREFVTKNSWLKGILTVAR